MSAQTTDVRPKLRVGLLLDDLTASRWAARMIEDIQRSHHSEIVVAVIGGHPPAAPVAGGRLARLFKEPRVLFAGAVRRGLEAAYGILIERNTYLPPSEQRVDLREFLGAVPVVEVQPIRTRWSDSLNESDLARVAAHDVDVLIRLGFRILRGGVLRVARYGVWSYHHGDNLLNRGGPPGLWESMQGWPVTGSVLQVLTEDLDNGQVLCRSFSCTNDMSVLDNRRNYFWKTLSFIPRKLRELHRLGAQRFFEEVRAENADPVLYSRRLYVQPTNSEFARMLAAKIWNKARTLWLNRRTLDQWILLIDLKRDLSSSFWRYQRIVPPADRFWADPFPVETDDGYAIFIEEYPYATARGHISVIEMDRAGKWKPPVPVLTRLYHLSYPFIFEHEGQRFMIPESAENETIELYRCIEFPLRWELHEVIMKGVKAYDSTIVEHEGRFWLFANMVEVEGASSWDELHLFWSDKPVGGRWTAHPRNPVVSDCRSARPAGRLFRQHGRLYRPSQNCSRRYGWGFNIARVDRLDDEFYEESVVTAVEPGWAPDIVATHTFNRAGDLHVIDAQMRRRR
jgi:hypothetical protein